MGNAMSNRRFNVGQTVNYTPGFIGGVNADAVFKITRLLPVEDDEFQCQDFVRKTPSTR